MKNYRVVVIIGFIEILIGASTLLVNILSLAFGTNVKSANILFFVMVAACVSTSLGVGILKTRKTAYWLLLYFSTVVIFSKLMAFLGVIHFDGQLEVQFHHAMDIPLSHVFQKIMVAFKDLVSIGYHVYVIHVLNQRNIRRIFHIRD